MVSKPDDWKWSRYKSTAYAGKVPEYLTIDWVLAQIAVKTTAAHQRYRKFVADGLSDKVLPWQKLVGQVFFGSDNFVMRMQELLEDKQEIKEIANCLGIHYTTVSRAVAGRRKK